MDVEEGIPRQPTDRHDTQISRTLLTRCSAFSSDGSINHDPLHHAPLSSIPPPFRQNPSIPSSSSSSSSSSFNYSPPKNTTSPKTPCDGEVAGGRGYTDYTSPPPNQTQPQNNTKLVLPPIIKLFREKELAKVMLLLIVPIIIAVFNLYSRLGHPPPPVLPHIILGFVLFGFSFIWNGLLLEETYPGVSVAAELLGSCSVILAIVLLVACAVPGVTLPWVLSGIFCFGLCLVPFFLALRHMKH